MAWTGDVARVHCDLISAQTYLQNAIAALEGMEQQERWDRARSYLGIASTTIDCVTEDLEEGVSPEVLDLLRGSVIPLERP